MITVIEWLLSNGCHCHGAGQETRGERRRDGNGNGNGNGNGDKERRRRQAMATGNDDSSEDKGNHGNDGEGQQSRDKTGCELSRGVISFYLRLLPAQCKAAGPSYEMLMQAAKCKTAKP